VIIVFQVYEQRGATRVHLSMQEPTRATTPRRPIVTIATTRALILPTEPHAALDLASVAWLWAMGGARVALTEMGIHPEQRND